MFGTFRARAKRWALGESSKKGLPQIWIEFELENETQDTVNWYGFFMEKSLKHTLKALRACGWTGTDISQIDGLDRKIVEVVLEEEEDDKGRNRTRVKWVNDPDAVVQKLDPNKARNLAAELKGKIAEFDRENNTPKPAAAPRPVAAASGEDDFPNV